METKFALTAGHVSDLCDDNVVLLAQTMAAVDALLLCRWIPGLGRDTQLV